MLLYRIFRHDPNAAPGHPGHPEYLHPGQGTGRWDNPTAYLGWYAARDQSAAVGEVFGDLAEWSGEMFRVPRSPSVRRALATYRVDDGLPLLDLDDANTLVRWSLRPSQVVSPNRPLTQLAAMSVYAERDSHGNQTWAGLQWWSSRRSYWPVCFIWGASPHVEAVEELDLEHPAVVDAARALSKPLQ